MVADSVGEHGGLPQIELAILSREGGREYNEDACGHWHSDSHLCCVVADGEAQSQMHSTVVSLFIDLDRGQALWGHAGDSRLYAFRDGQLLAHTRDHSLVQSLVEAGLLTEDQMRTHPRRSELHSALGTAAEDLQITTITRPWQLIAGDVFLLCTDGLWEYVEDEQMCESLKRAGDPSAWLTNLEQIVLRTAEEANKPGHDNFSGVAVWIGQPSR